MPLRSPELKDSTNHLLSIDLIVTGVIWSFLVNPLFLPPYFWVLKNVFSALKSSKKVIWFLSTSISYPFPL